MYTLSYMCVCVIDVCVCLYCVPQSLMLGLVHAITEVGPQLCL